ncbi:FeS assembly protein SufB [Alicyclobacillus hesperidum URH17-3-68]|nr:FeS assembly protein SufB [Alicyclobacillus hesperidum URH17-3-68]
MLDAHIAQIESSLSLRTTNTTTTTAINVTPHIHMLRQYKAQATTKQKEVLDVMKQNPGPIWSDELRAALPYLAKQGSMSGVFRARRVWARMGGAPQDDPFYQISYDRQRGGQYRGLKPDEAAQI